MYLKLESALSCPFSKKKKNIIGTKMPSQRAEAKVTENESAEYS
jgi:hypothetical protein